VSGAMKIRFGKASGPSWIGVKRSGVMRRGLWLEIVRLLGKGRGANVVFWHASRRNAKIVRKNPYLLRLFLS
jgi:hypothetical protein